MTESMGPYLLGFSLICGILSYGMMKRPTWMWYAGWAILYLLAGYLGTMFIGNLIAATTVPGMALAFAIFFGGFAFWMPLALFWFRKRELFGRKKRKISSQRVANKTENGADPTV